MDLRGIYPNLKNNLGDFMYRCLKIIFVIISLNFTYSETISGTIIDNRTGEPLIGANVILDGTDIGAATDLEGRFEINNLEGSYGEYVLSNNQENISFDIYNNGWVTQDFKYQLFDMNNGIQSEGEVNILHNNQININTGILNNESSFFILRVFPSNNLNNFQDIIFANEIVTGDFNDDFQVLLSNLTDSLVRVLKNLQSRELPKIHPCFVRIWPKFLDS